MKWPTAALGDVALIDRKSVTPTDIVPGSRYVGLEHIESGGGSLSFGNVSKGELASTKFRFGPHHILYGKLRPNLAKIACPDFDGVCSTDILPIAPGRRIDRRYLLHFLRNPRTVQWASSRATGVNLPRLSPSELALLEIPLPPIGEQRKIAVMLDRADEIYRMRKRALGMLGTLVQSVFFEMFGDPRLSPSRWPQIRFSDACEDETSLYRKVQQSSYAKIGAFPVIDQGKSFIAGWVDDTELVNRAENGVIVFGDHTRSVKYVNFDFVVGADGAKVLRPKGKFEPRFFAELLRVMPIPDLGYSRHMRVLKELTFPCPPLTRQLKFAAYLEHIQQQKRLYEVSSEKVKSLFLQLQLRSFAGEFV